MISVRKAKQYRLRQGSTLTLLSNILIKKRGLKKPLCSNTLSPDDPLTSEPHALDERVLPCNSYPHQLTDPSLLESVDSISRCCKGLQNDEKLNQPAMSRIYHGISIADDLSSIQSFAYHSF